MSRTIDNVNRLIRTFGRDIQFTDLLTPSGDIRFRWLGKQFVINRDMTLVEEIEGSFRVCSDAATLVANQLGEVP